MAYTFVNARLDDGAEQGSQGGPSFLTTVMPLANGGEKRNGEWQYPRISWNIAYGIQSNTDLSAVQAFYTLCMGRLYGFRFRDWGDYIIGDEDTQAPQQIGLGDSVTVAFSAYKNYTVIALDGVSEYITGRPITRLVQGTCKVYVNGVLKTETTDYSIDYDTGVITFVAPPPAAASVSLYGEFDIAVRFDSDVMKIRWEWFGAGSVPSITVREIRETTKSILPILENNADTHYISGSDAPLGTNAAIDLLAGNVYLFGSTGIYVYTYFGSILGSPGIADASPVVTYTTYAAMGISSPQIQTAALDLDGYIWIQDGASNSDPYKRIDPSSMTVTATLGAASSALSDSTAGMVLTGNLNAYPFSVGGAHYMAVAGEGGIASNAIGVFTTSGAGAFYGADNNPTAHGYVVLTGVDSSGNIYSMTSDNSVTSVDLLKTPLASPTMTTTVIATYFPATIDATWTTMGGGNHGFVDPVDGNIITFFHTNDTMSAGHSQSVIAKLNATTGAIMWSKPINAIPHITPQTSAAAGVFAFLGGTGPSYVGATDAPPSGYALQYTFDLSTGSYTTANIQAAIGGTSAVQTFNATTGMLTYFGTLVRSSVSSNSWNRYPIVPMMYGVPYDFVNARLDENIEQGSQGGAEFLTTVMGLSSGQEVRHGEWQYPKSSWDISYGLQSDTNLKQVRDFFRVCFGRLFAFRFKDWGDYIIGDPVALTPQQIGTGDGTTTAFQVAKAYSANSWDNLTTYTFTRKLTRLVPGTVQVYVAGVLKTENTDYTVDYNTGIVTFSAAPVAAAVVSVYGEFDVPVRFDIDSLMMQWVWSGAGSIPSIKIIEVVE